jgi:putative ABC transport system permease protein
MDTAIQDLRFAFRSFRHRPAFTLAAVLTLALGIGANTAIFSAVDSLLFRPLPVPDADRLVTVAAVDRSSGFPGAISYPDYRDVRALGEVFSDAAAFSLGLAQLSGDGLTPERVLITFASGNYFDVLRVPPAAGRTFTAEEADTPGRGDVIVLSHGYWRRTFAGDPSVVGRAVRLNSRPFTVVGVAPEGFPGTSGVVETQLYVPAAAEARLYPPRDPGAVPALEDRGERSYQVVARLAPGTTIEQARATVTVLSRRLAQEYPDSNGTRTGVVYPEPMTRLELSAAVYLPPLAAVFMLLVGLVLLIACANVANLLLAQAAGRRKEISIRAALGSGRLRIVRQLLTESVLLGLAGAAGGLLVAWWATRVLSSFRIASDFPIRIDITMSYRVFAYAIGIALLTGIVTGLVPAFQSARTNLVEALKEGGRSSGHAGRQRLRGLLVVSQVSVSLALLTCAALFLESLRNFASMDLGFRTDHRLILTTEPGLLDYDEARGRAFHRDLLDRVRALPGVVAASATATVPIGVGNYGTQVWAEGRERREEERHSSIPYNVVDTGYFEVMGTPILRGRGFVDDDGPDSRKVVVVNEVLAERLWPGEEALGRRLSVEGPEGPFLDVVGVARLSRYNLPGEAPQGYLYLPFSQRYRSSRILEVHTEGDPRALIPRIRREIAALDPQMPVYDVRTMETHIREGKGAVLFQFASGIVGSFGLIGVVLACVGLYGVMAYSVTQRVHELGVRMAVGATGARILALVLRQGLVLILAGVAVGLAGAFALTGRFSGLLVGVSPRDPLTFAGVALLLVAVGLVSAWIPARRATRVDPLAALRCE